MRKAPVPATDFELRRLSFSAAGQVVRQRGRSVKHAIFDHVVDIGGVRDVVDWIRFQNHEVGEVPVVDLSDVRTGLTAEKFGRVNGGALQDLYRGEARLFH